MGRILGVVAGLAALSVAGCAGPDLAPFGTGTQVQRQIDTAFTDRNACLARNASQYEAGRSDATAMARALAGACQSQIDHLIAVSNPHRDPKVADAIRQDSEFRALAYVSRPSATNGKS